MNWRSLSSVAIALLLVAPSAWAQSQETETQPEKPAAEEPWTPVKTRYVAGRGSELPFVIPIKEADKIALPISRLALPLGFAIKQERDGLKLGLDLDGDGKSESWVKGQRSRFPVVLKDAADKRSPYQFYVERTTNSGTTGKPTATFTFRRDCYRVGRHLGQTITLIDDNSNGRYDDAGQDVIVVGRSPYGVPLGPKVRVRGKLFEIKVSPDGEQIQLRPWSGQTGTVDALKGFVNKAAGKPVAVLLTGAAGNFNLLDGQGRPTVPAGSYQLRWGVIKAGSQTAHMRSQLTVEVKPDEVVRPEWGGPFKLNYAIRRAGIDLTIDPNQITVSGSRGEVYYNFGPTPMMAKLLVRDAKTKEVLLKRSSSGQMRC